tara:strand:- start:325 stop:543 length:219 start_codon:yes stop_codon:yes gene_type:complete
MPNAAINEAIDTVVTQVNDAINPILSAVGIENKERFTNDFQLNQTCMLLIVLYVFLFLYKKEVMVMVNKYLK